MRAGVLATIALALLVCTPEDGRTAPMSTGNEKDFAERMGFRTRAPRPANEGVMADWSLLPVETKAVRGGWTFAGSKVVPRSALGGAALAEWIYEGKVDKHRRLIFQIIVFNNGQVGAIQQMEAAGNSSHMLVNPFGPAPEAMKLGDWTAVSSPAEVAVSGRTHNIFWVNRNVFAWVKVLPAEAGDALPIARTIQTFMERYAVNDLPTHFPKSPMLKVSPASVALGESFRAEMLGTPSPSWRVRINPIEGELKLRSKEGNVAVFEAQAPGTAVVEGVIVDEKTLLSVWHRATVEVVASAQ